MVRLALKILYHLVQDLYIVFDYFGALCSKGLASRKAVINSCLKYVASSFIENTTLHLHVKHYMYLAEFFFLKKTSVEVYLRPCQTSLVEFFAKLFMNFDYFRKKAPSQMSDRTLNTPLVTITFQKLFHSHSR